MVGRFDLLTSAQINEAAFTLEGEGKLEEAKRLYWKNVNMGFEGSFPYERLRIIYAKEEDWEGAIKACQAYIKLRVIPEREKRRMKESIREYKAKLGIGGTTPITAKHVLIQALKKASISMRRQPCEKSPQFKPARTFPKWARGEVTLHQIHVPKFNCVHRAHAVEFMDSEQKNFYEMWIKYWKRGKPIDVKGNISYLFPYTYIILRKALKNPQDAIYELRLLQHVYKHEQRFHTYLKQWIFDAYILNKEYWNAIAYVQAQYGVEYRKFTSQILSLKYKMGAPISGGEIIGLLDHKPRKLVLDNIDFVSDHIDQIVREFEKENNIDLLSLITMQFAIGPPRSSSYGSYLFSSTGISVPPIEVDFFDYSSLGDFEIVIDQWVKNAENALRKAKGLPKIGEGWVSEAMLYRIILEIFEDLGYEVIHHSYPPFLGRQELDIHIPALNLGIEFMGKQHFEPVEFFGGEEGFKKITFLDKRKKRLCEKNGITLVYFKYDEPINESYVRVKLSEALSSNHGFSN